MSLHSLLKQDDKLRETVAALAVETYEICRHYSADEYPQLIDGDPLSAAFDRVARAAVAVALARLAQDREAPLTDEARDHLTGLAVGLDLIAVEIDTGAW